MRNKEGWINLDESGKARKISRVPFIAIFVVAVLFLVAGPISRYVCDYMWYRHDAQHPEIWSKTISSGFLLGTLGFLIAFATSFLVLKWATRSQIVYDRVAQGAVALAAEKALRTWEWARPGMVWIASAFLGLISAGAMSGQVENYWMFSNGVPFGKTDAIFGLDLGFFVFRLPFLEALVNAFLFVVVILSLITIANDRVVASFAERGGATISGSSSRSAMLTILGVTMLVIAGRTMLARLGMGTVDSGQFFGPGYASLASLGIMTYVALMFAIMGIGLLAFGLFKVRIKPAFATLSVAVLGVTLLILAIVPGLIQRIKVDPNRLAIESPYANRAIEATRYGYGIDDGKGQKFEVNDFNVQPEPTAAEVKDSDQTLRNMRLWDPEVMQVAVNGLQSLRPYYQFNDVDIDRYMIDGEPRMVMLSARNINVDGLSPNAKNWLTEKLQYSHGFGLVMAPVDEALNTGRPNFWIRNLPPVSTPSLKIDQPRIYFADYAEGSAERNSYLLLKGTVEEFDYPAQNDKKTRWTGTRGVPVGSYFAKLIHSLRFGDGNLLVSPNITSDTRVVYRRDITDRAQAIYPFLRFDADPYLVLAEGKLYWILDAYTTSRKVPYSALTTGPLGTLNYVRNSVKIVQDAYEGTMTAYQAVENEPILEMVKKTFPNLIQPMADMPAELQSHLRYGEDQFLHQAAALTQYHVTDPITFLNNEDAWEIPTEIGRGGYTEVIKPYYVQMRLPNEKRDAFMLILPFTPRGKANMIGWMAAHCDQEDYGKVVLYKFPKDTQTQGPNQMEATFNSDPVVADLNRQLNNDQSQIVPGNMLVIPIGSSILYVKPLFLQARSSGIQPIPELKKVVLGLQNRVVVGNSYQEALDKLFGGSSPTVPQAPLTDPSSPQSPTGNVSKAEVMAIGKLLDDADAALRSGDFAKYGELQRQARERLKALGK